MSLENNLKFAEEYKLQLEEVFFVQLLLLAQPEEDHSEYLYRYLSINSENRLSPRKTLLKLQEKGIILKSYKVPDVGDKFYPEGVEFNKLFLYKYHQYSSDLGAELWEKYPPILNVKGINFTAKNISKKFNSLEEFFFAYGKAIKFNLEKHKEVLELLDWAIQNKLVNCGICEYVISNQWTTHKQLKDQGFDGNSLIIDELI